MSDNITKLIELVTDLLDDCNAFNSALELYDVDGEKWAKKARETLKKIKDNLEDE